MPDEQELQNAEAAGGDAEENHDAPAPRAQHGGGGPGGASNAPRNNTQQEAAYLRRLIDQHIPITVKVRGGESVAGVIEYYDSSFIRLTRDGQPNLFIFKKDILYLREDSPLADTPTPEPELAPETAQ